MSEDAITPATEAPPDKPDAADLPEAERAETTIPEVAEAKIPLWIKLMWLGFIIWIIWYVVMGMQSSPKEWA